MEVAVNGEMMGNKHEVAFCAHISVEDEIGNCDSHIVLR